MGTICGSHHVWQDVDGRGGLSDKKCGRWKRGDGKASPALLISTIYHQSLNIAYHGDCRNYVFVPMCTACRNNNTVCRAGADLHSMQRRTQTKFASYANRDRPSNMLHFHFRFLLCGQILRQALSRHELTALTSRINSMLVGYRLTTLQKYIDIHCTRVAQA